MSPEQIEPRPVPNPGSEAALAMGCTCNPRDNNRGKYAPYPPDGWWKDKGCPVHEPPLITDLDLQPRKEAS